MVQPNFSRFEAWRKGRGGYLDHSSRTEILDRAVFEAAKRHSLSEIELLVYLESYASACDTDKLVLKLNEMETNNLKISNRLSFEDMIEHFRLAIGKAKWCHWHGKACDELESLVKGTKLAAS